MSSSFPSVSCKPHNLHLSNQLLTSPLLLSICLISIIRIVSISRLDFSDISYQFTTVAYWGAVEVNLAIICACLTTLKPLLVRFFPKLLGGSIATRYGTTPNAVPPASRSADVTRGGGQKKRMLTVEEREFARLEDGESVKSEQSLVRGYEMEVVGGGITRPGRVYGK